MEVDERCARTARTSGGESFAISVITVTFCRDEVLLNGIAQVRELIRDRRDIEYILVDNNPDSIDRSMMLQGLPHGVYIKLGSNKGVSARNDGASVARGEILIFIDDDAVMHPLDALDRVEGIFALHPQLAIVSARHIDAHTGDTPRASFPHTDKSLVKTRPFETFRFQGNGFCMRRSAYERIGPMSNDYFYGLEEIDYAYRVIEHGFHLRYDPSIWVIEHNDPGGRQPKRRVEEMRLTNKMIISWKYMPMRFLPINIISFTAYVLFLNRGRLNVVRAYADFLWWLRRNRGRRAPIGAQAQAYIRACGGQVWK